MCKKMTDNRDSFEFSVGMSGFSLKAQGKVTALLSAMMSIGALTVAAYFAQEAFLPMMKKKMQLEEGEEGEEGNVQRRRLAIRSKRSAPLPNDLPEADMHPLGMSRMVDVTTEEIEVDRKRPVYVAAGISLLAVATSVYFGRKAWINFAGRVSKLPSSE